MALRPATTVAAVVIVAGLVTGTIVLRGRLRAAGRAKAAVAAPPPAPRLEMLELGLEPRRVLRFGAGPAPARSVSKVKMRFQLRNTVQDHAPDSTEGTIELVATNQLLEQLPGDQLRHELRFDGARLVSGIDLQPEMERGLQTLAHALSGARLEQITTPRGANHHLVQEWAPGTDAETARQLNAITDPAAETDFWPLEPVGVGASWRLVRQVDVDDLRRTRSTVYRVLALDKGTVKLAIQESESAQPQRVAPERHQLPAGTVVTMVELRGETLSTQTFHLPLPWAVQVASSSSEDITYLAMQGDQHQELVHHEALTIGIEPQ